MSDGHHPASPEALAAIERCELDERAGSPPKPGHLADALVLTDEVHRLVRELTTLRDAALALSRAVEPADLPPAARPALLVLRAHLAAGGADPVGEEER